MVNNHSLNVTNGALSPCHVAADDNHILTISKATAIGTAAINGFTSPVAVITNLLVLVTILGTPSIQNPSNILLGCLLLTDLLVGLIVQPMAIFLNLYPTQACNIRLADSFSEYTLICITFTTITAIACEKYVTLFHPFVRETHVNPRRVFMLSVFIWIFWLLVIPLRIFWSNTAFWSLLGIAWGCSLLTSVTVYAKIFKLVQYHQRGIRTQQKATNVDSMLQRKSAITMGYIIGVLFVCYIPLGGVLLYKHNGGSSRNASVIAEAWSETLFYVTSSLNAIIYCCRNEDMRRAVFVLLNRLKVFCMCSNS